MFWIQSTHTHTQCICKIHWCASSCGFADWFIERLQYSQSLHLNNFSPILKTLLKWCQKSIAKSNFPWQYKALHCSKLDAVELSRGWRHFRCFVARQFLFYKFIDFFVAYNLQAEKCGGVQKMTNMRCDSKILHGAAVPLSRGWRQFRCDLIGHQVVIN